MFLVPTDGGCSGADAHSHPPMGCCGGDAERQSQAAAAEGREWLWGAEERKGGQEGCGLGNAGAAWQRSPADGPRCSWGDRQRELCGRKAAASGTPSCKGGGGGGCGRSIPPSCRPSFLHPSSLHPSLHPPPAPHAQPPLSLRSLLPAGPSASALLLLLFLPPLPLPPPTPPPAPSPSPAPWRCCPRGAGGQGPRISPPRQSPEPLRRRSLCALGRVGAP